MTEFYMRNPTIDSRIPRDAIIDVDYNPTMYYYGTWVDNGVNFLAEILKKYRSN